MTPQSLFSLFLFLSLLALSGSIALHFAQKSSSPTKRLFLLEEASNLVLSLVFAFLISASLFLFVAMEKTVVLIMERM